MKKLLLFFITMCVTVPAQALDKHDLESVIRSLDVTSVKQIIENEKLTVREYNRYLTLAAEVVFNRELWTRAWDISRDASTPYVPSKMSSRIPLECITAICMIFGGIKIMTDSRLETWEFYGAGMMFSGYGLLFKFAFDCIGWAEKEGEKRRKLFQKKYEDALTIQQLIYAADIIES